jgi:hypothetical protein
MPDTSQISASRRYLLKAAAAVLVDQWAETRFRAFGGETTRPRRARDCNVIVLACGGIRRAETFSEAGVANISHLYSDLLPQSTFFARLHNEGVTSHYNTISSMLTGEWQRVDDWGKTPPESPTIFEYLRRTLRLPQNDVWFISSNKALTSKIGASSVREYGSSYGPNVIFPKQMLINAVVKAAAEGRASRTSDRVSMQAEIQDMLQADNYEGLGWTVSGDVTAPDTATHDAIFTAIKDLVQTSAPVTGDEFTFLVAQRIMRSFAPSLLFITFSDVEVAHFGSYSLHLAGIRTLDRLAGELWQEIRSNPVYSGKTTLFIVPEFGRDLDGSSTNGFFNHREDADSTRLTWMMCLGNGANPGSVVTRPVRHIDLCPTIAGLFGLNLPPVRGELISEIAI